MDSPRAQTRAWSAMVMGLVRKKKPRVMWKSESEVMIVFADMRAMLAFWLPGDSCVEKWGEAECEDGQMGRQTDGVL